MEQHNLENLPIIPEEHDVEHMKGIDFSNLNSKMYETERRFLMG